MTQEVVDPFAGNEAGRTEFVSGRFEVATQLREIDIRDQYMRMDTIRGQVVPGVTETPLVNVNRFRGGRGEPKFSSLQEYAGSHDPAVQTYIDRYVSGDASAVQEVAVVLQHTDYLRRDVRRPGVLRSWSESVDSAVQLLATQAYLQQGDPEVTNESVDPILGERPSEEGLRQQLYDAASRFAAQRELSTDTPVSSDNFAL